MKNNTKTNGQNYVTINTQLKVFIPFYQTIKEAVLIGFTNERISYYLNIKISFVQAVRNHLKNSYQIPIGIYGSRNFSYKDKPFVGKLANGKSRIFEPVESIVWAVNIDNPLIDPEFFQIPKSNCYWVLKLKAPRSLNEFTQNYNTVDKVKLILGDVFTNAPEVRLLTEEVTQELSSYRDLYPQIAGQKSDQLDMRFKPVEQTVEPQVEQEVEKTEEWDVTLPEGLEDENPFALIPTVEIPEVPTVTPVIDALVRVSQADKLPKVPKVTSTVAKESPLTLVYAGLRITFLVNNKEVIVRDSEIEIK